ARVGEVGLLDDQPAVVTPPAMPTPLFAAAQAIDATCVPCPTSSVVAGPWRVVLSKSSAATTLPANSGWLASTPVPMTPTRAPAPVVKSHACGNPPRRRHHST